MKRAIALCLVLMMTLALLTGCKLIVKDEAVDAATTAVTVNGQPITKGEINTRAQQMLRELQVYQSMQGERAFDPTNPEILTSVRNAAIEEKTREAVITQKMKAYGVEPLTDAEKEAAVSELYRQATMLGYDPAHPDSTDSVAALMYAESWFGLPDAVTAMADAADEKLMPVVTADLATVTDLQVEEAYQAKVEEDRNAYAGLAAYANAVNNGAAPCYVPGEVRMVKQILIRFTEEDQDLLDENDEAIGELEDEIAELRETVTDEELAATETDLSDDAQSVLRLEALKAQREQERKQLLADAYAHVREEADQVAADLHGGADWDAESADHNDDPGMYPDRPTAKTGYAVFEGYADFDSAFVETAMKLENPGDISDPAEGSYGFYILRLEEIRTEGPVPLETVRDSLRAEALHEAQHEIYESLVDQWLMDAEVIRVDGVFD